MTLPNRWAARVQTHQKGTLQTACHRKRSWRRPEPGMFVLLCLGGGLIGLWREGHGGGIRFPVRGGEKDGVNCTGLNLYVCFKKWEKERMWNYEKITASSRLLEAVGSNCADRSVD